MFLFNKRPVPYCSSYKYLGSYINEFVDFTFTVDKHAESAGRALGSIITKMIKNNGFPYSVFELLYTACVTSVSDYSGAFTGHKDSQSLLKLHLRAIRSFLGVPKNACNSGVLSEVDLLLPKCRGRIAMIRHYHRMIKMTDDRLTKQVMAWDYYLNENNAIKTWSYEVKEIFRECNLFTVYDTSQIFDLKQIATAIKSSYFIKQCNDLKLECQNKPKLRTFIMFKNFQEQPSYIGKPLTFHQRRMIAKTRLGCLPLRIETGRYSFPRLKEEERVCLVCKPKDLIVDLGTDVVQPIESEFHFLFECTGYEVIRNQWLDYITLPDDFKRLTDGEKLKIALNTPDNIRATAKFITDAFNLRSTILR